jgi:homogentisate 1,2-dioxygenase
MSYHPAASSTARSPEVSRPAEALRTEEVAVMIDTFAPLGVSDAARAVADPDYPWTWAR